MNTLPRRSNTCYRSVLCIIITLAYRLYSFWLLTKINKNPNCSKTWHKCNSRVSVPYSNRPAEARRPLRQHCGPPGAVAGSEQPSVWLRLDDACCAYQWLAARGCYGEVPRQTGCEPGPGPRYRAYQWQGAVHGNTTPQPTVEILENVSWIR